MWPGSVRASQELVKYRHQVMGKVVLVLGAGTGVEAQTAASLGAERVIALDINGLTLRLLEYGAQLAGFGDVIEGRVFDLFSNEPLPPCDIVVAADVLYNEELATQIGLRCLEVLAEKSNRPSDSLSSLSPSPTKIVVTDSQNFHGTDFLGMVNAHDDRNGLALLEWDEEILVDFTGSGVMIDEDQHYNITVRTLSTGWET